MVTVTESAFRWLANIQNISVSISALLKRAALAKTAAARLTGDRDFVT
jgi:hypothetical protein